MGYTDLTSEESDSILSILKAIDKGRFIYQDAARQEPAPGGFS